MNRYDDEFNSVPSVFAPEKYYYKSSILMNGLPCYVVGAVILGLGILFLFFRYFIVALLKKSKSTITVTRFRRNFFLSTAGVGILLYIAGMIVSLQGTMSYKYFSLSAYCLMIFNSTALRASQSSLKDNGRSITIMTETFKQISDSINVD